MKEGWKWFLGIVLIHGLIILGVFSFGSLCKQLKGEGTSYIGVIPREDIYPQSISQGIIYNHETGQEISRDHPCVVLDAGHGGIDGGKCGIHGELEKDINLQMTLLLKEVLEERGFQVVLTRDSDDGLYAEDSENHKMQDLSARVAIMEEVDPLFVISIHQNSYTMESAKGAQVFYYTESEEGKILATMIQNAISRELQPENHREIKANDSYYLLRKTSHTIVIVECGFLSNDQEAKLLTMPDYQQKMVEAIADGIVEYYRNDVL